MRRPRPTRPRAGRRARCSRPSSALPVEESLIDAVTALSAAAGALPFALLEAMIAGGEAAGLPGDA
ncbi:MAG: pyrroline-5-carboxylate reductase dimerization domain-containing protein [Myxococcota bacterium]